MEIFGNIHGISWELLRNHLGILFTSPPRRNSSHNCSVSRHYVARKSGGKRLEQQDEDDDGDDGRDDEEEEEEDDDGDFVLIFETAQNFFVGIFSSYFNFVTVFRVLYQNLKFTLTKLRPKRINERS